MADPAIKITGFIGEQPRILPRLLPASAATDTRDARLDDGGLAPYRAAVPVTTLASSTYDTIYRYGAEWLGFTGTVNLAPGPVAEDRLYYTGDGVPKLRVGSTIYPLAVPRPTTAPGAVASGVGTGDVITRSYIYTFVTSLGEESEPSEASAEVNWQSGQTVTLSGIENAPGSPFRGVDRQRFYRTQTGSAGTDFYFIAERAVSNADFVDNLAIDDFAEPCPSKFYNAPPADLSGLTALPNGMMAAFSGRKLYFSEPFQPHAWPEKYVQITDKPIVALGASDTTLLVTTEGFPYTVTGSAPDAMVMQKVESNYPCINARSVVDLGYSIAYATNEGLAVAQPGGGIRLVTQNLFATREWQQLNPAGMTASQIDGRWIGSYSAIDDDGNDISGSLIINLSDNSFLIRTGTKARAWHFAIGTGELFYLVGNTVYQFDPPGGDPLTLYWKSKPFVLARPDNLGVILVETNNLPTDAARAARDAIIAALTAQRAALIAAGVTGGSVGDSVFAGTTLGGDMMPGVPHAITVTAEVGVYADGSLVATITKLDAVARLPAGFKARIWEFAVSTNVAIAQITAAKSVQELKQIQNG